MQNQAGANAMAGRWKPGAQSTAAAIPQQAACRRIGKQRRPHVVILLCLVTFGLYSIIYYYCTFEELRNWRGQGWSGATYLILQFLFPLPLIVMPWLIPAYVGRLYGEACQQKPITGYTGFWILIPLIGAIIWIYRIQTCMNHFWQQQALSTPYPRSR